MVLGALVLVAVATYIDTGSSVSTRVSQLLVSQPLIAFAGTLFIGPVFIFGLGQVLADGGRRMTTFIALFNVTQSVGTLTGNAFTQTYLFHAQQYHLGVYAAQATRSEPEVAALLSTLAARYAPVITDPTLRTAEGVAALTQQITQYARVAAYVDVFTAISLAASAGALALLSFIAVSHFKLYRSKLS
jgi:hypothetical protein